MGEEEGGRALWTVCVCMCVSVRVYVCIYVCANLQNVVHRRSLEVQDWNTIIAHAVRRTLLPPACECIHSAMKRESARESERE